MTTIYRKQQGQFGYIPPSDNRFVKIPAQSEVKSKDKLSFKSFNADPSTQPQNTIVDQITEKILITFFNDPNGIERIKKQTEQYRNLEKLINQEIKQGTKLNEIF
ncbi:MAG TPA: hypothetical protein P5556_03295 [Candidatus Gastranaerophilales bacterium]|nr:hypothetical protein [Candidatus Gastranaerophilales bacterium]